MHDKDMKMRGQFSKVGFLFPPCGCRRASSGCQTLRHMPLPIEPAHQTDF